MKKFRYLAKASGQVGVWLVTSSALSAGIAIWEHIRGASITGVIATVVAVLLLLITAYTVASREYDAKIAAGQELVELKRQMAEVPRIKMVDNSFKCDERFLYPRTKDGMLIAQIPIRSLVVQFINQPEFHVDTANARDVVAKAQFFNIDGGEPKLLLEDYPRWATNDDPEPGKTNKHLVPTDIRIGEAVELDLAVKYLNELEAFAVTHQSYALQALKHSTPLEGRKFLIRLALNGVNVKEKFEFTFENLGRNQPLRVLTMRQC